MVDEIKPPMPENMQISSGSGGPLRSDRGTDSLRGVGKFIGFALLFNLLLWLFALFAQIRGWVDVTASYFILLGMWAVGTLICLALGAQLRLQRNRLAIALGSVIWAAALIGLNAVAPKPVKVRVTITPNQVRFSSEPLENYIFTVTNRTPDDAYGVQLQFRLDSPDGKYGEMSPQVPAGSRKPIVAGSPLSDIGGLLCHDSEGHPFLMMRIYRLVPGEKREISFTSKGFTDGTTLEAEVSSSTKEPQPRRDDPASVSDTFTIDRSLKCSRSFHCMAGDGVCRTNGTVDQSHEGNRVH